MEKIDTAAVGFRIPIVLLFVNNDLFFSGPWVGNCIGVNNHKYFMGYLALLSILAAFTMWGCWVSFAEGCYSVVQAPLEAGSYFEVVRAAFVCKPWVAWVICNAAFHFSWVTMLTICQTYQVSNTLLFTFWTVAIEIQ